ncbi:MAG: FAD-dependent oxidoreductase [Rikenellaceae bacterium]
MIIQDFATDKRSLKIESVSSDVVVVGGGLSGVCAAIAAAREGATVSLIQDRPVLGGNASSEVRVWVLGATSHMGNNNRWSREGGIIDEILLENLYRNKEGNPLFFDMVVMDKVLNEKNITLYLNTVVHDLEKQDERNISKVIAFNPQNSIHYEFSGHTYVDASGDGILGYLAGAAYRIGAESAEEYGELFAPDKEYGEVLGHSIFFYTKECKEPVEFHAPDFAINDAEKYIPKLNNPNYFNIKQHGCKYWWLEYGGRLDTIGDTEKIKYELWKVVYGVWDYIKNSGKFPETANQTLEWVAAISGKRESRRFYGYYDLIQQDIIEQRNHYDAVAFGGWSIDLHPADAVYSELNGCNQWHSKGIYQIPYRCYVNRDIDNMFLCGRNISATHVAHASSRVMCTAAHGGQAVGVAAALCAKSGAMPKDYISESRVVEIQKRLIKNGQFIPDLTTAPIDNKLFDADIITSSTFEWSRLPISGFKPLSDSVAQLIPSLGKLPTIEFNAIADECTTLELTLRKSLKRGNFTPDVIIETKVVSLNNGENKYTVDFNYSNDESEYLFITFSKNEHVKLAYSDVTISGSVAVYNTVNPAVSNYGKQTPPDNIGVEEFEFWCPKRWPEHQNLALGFTPALKGFDGSNLYNSAYRPVDSSNCWMAALDNAAPCVELNWDSEQEISSVTLFFDGDSNQALENNQMGHFYNVIPQCVREYAIYDVKSNLISSVCDNHQAQSRVVLPHSISTSQLIIRFKQNSPLIPVSLHGIIIE